MQHNIATPTNSRTTTHIISGINTKATTQSEVKKAQNVKDRFRSVKTQRKDKTRPTVDAAIYNSITELPKPTIIKRRPSIVFVCDMVGWAWWIKSHYLKRYLSSYYDIDIVAIYGKERQKLDKSKYDMYFTFGHSFIDNIRDVPAHKRITGVTAQRDRDVLEPQMKKAPVVHANSMLLYNQIKEYHPLVFYVPNGVDTKLFKDLKYLPVNDNFTVGHVAKLSAQKHQQDILMPVIKQCNVKSKLHLNNVNNRLPHDQMPTIYQGISLYVVCSTEDGTPNGALEAMSCGIPVLSNNIGNMPEILPKYNCGKLTSSLNVDEYVRSIDWFRYQLSADELNKMGRNARLAMEQEWDWSIKYKNYLYMFDKIFGISRPIDTYIGVDEVNLERYGR